VPGGRWRRLYSTALVAAVVVEAAALAWTRTPTPAKAPPSIRIVDVRPLTTPDASLRDLITHTFAVRVAVSGWELLPYEPAAPEKRRDAGHWRLYLDGRSLGDNFGGTPVTYTPYLPPGGHWLAAELRNADGTALATPVWSEPVILHVPRVVRCWQTGWRGSAEAGRPAFRCRGSVRR